MTNVTTSQLITETDTDMVSMQTRRVLQHHFKAAGKFDIEGTMQDYSEEAILIGMDTSYAGIDAIRNFYTSTFQMLSQGPVTFELTKLVIVKDMAFIIWKEKTNSFEIPFGTDTFIIQDGKIVGQTGFAHVVPVIKDR